MPRRSPRPISGRSSSTPTCAALASTKCSAGCRIRGCRTSWSGPRRWPMPSARSAVPNLHVLPAGHIPPNPAELLGSPRFKELLRELGRQFDWVIIDAPPVMAVTDAALVGNMATGVVFVIGAEMTSRRHAAVAIEQLANAQAKFIGADSESRQRSAPRVLLLDVLPQGLRARLHARLVVLPTSCWLRARPRTRAADAPSCVRHEGFQFDATSPPTSTRRPQPVSEPPGRHTPPSS